MRLDDILGDSAEQLAGRNLTLEAASALREEARDRARQIMTRSAGDDLTGADATDFDAAASAAERLAEVIAPLQQRRDRANALVGAVRGDGGARLERGSNSERDDRRPVSARDTAMRALERAVTEHRLDQTAASTVETLMSAGTGSAQSWTQRWAVAAGSAAYERAFSKALTGERGHLLWTPEEAEAYRAVSALQVEQRAMGGVSDPAGGFMVPLTLDPAILLTSNGSTNPMRALARVVQITTDSWNGVTSAGVTAEWIAEAVEVADASPTLAQPSVPVFKADAFVPYSFELEGDAPNLAGELSTLLLDAADQLTAAAYTVGTGVGQPTGVITALSSVTSSKVAPSTAETITAADVFTVQNALPPRFQPNAAWCANLSVINTLRQFETGSGALKFPGLQDTPPSLLGRAMNENSLMGGVPNGSVTASNYPLLYGDFTQGMLIADRVGSTIELVPHMFGANRRPTGQRGLLLWFRTGSAVINPNALRVLSVPTTA